MSEVMAIESIVEEYAKFQGYLTETRVPFKLKSGNNSDIDVLGYKPKTEETLMVECKAWGSPNQYPSFNGKISWIRGVFKKMIKNWGIFKESPTNKWGIRSLNELWFILPGFCDDKEQVEKMLTSEFGKTIKIIPIHELLINVMAEVKRDKDIRRKRYSNPALEFCRWLLRSYEKGHLSLLDIDLKLNKNKQKYDLLKKHYIKECMSVAKENATKRNADINTRIRTLELLVKLKKATTSQIRDEGNRQGYNLNHNRVRVGLGTWIDLGIVSKNDKKEFFIIESFFNIVKKELK